ncbi:winged helix-turn-helix domain-containing protein [Streptomyces kunmingensis]|uniref:Winged helix-turn-helix domain-containing protein n=1 Tax=Streptomyces kunmingensis TaxID=68225 RepID=A0ABU6C4H1_9ACTN|nr:winged helix-turn-helix domain-containing protein [Streptomyces kunmingensis]MEB3959517.1 winged helix-turn-helix domain-containing protein [Streptomyces kunmingensis]
MANARSLSPLPGPLAPARTRLRAVDRDEVAPTAPTALVPTVDVADFLPPGATLLPAPPHTLPTLPGRPPMIGYLVLVPADQQPAPPTASLPAASHPAASHPVANAAPAGSGADSASGPSDALIGIDDAQRTASVLGRQLDLTYLEFELLAHLVAHPHRVHTRDALVTTVWGYGHVGDGRTVDVHIARLRRKLGAEHRQAIQTVRRVGYKYAPPVTAR